MISSDPDETLADLRACFSRATALDGMVERSFTISGYQVRLRFRGQELVSETADAFAHLPETSGHEELVLNSWIADAPELLPALRPHMVNHPAAIAELRLGRPEIRAHHNGGTGLTVVYDPSSGEAWRWMRPGSPLPWWERAAPMRAVLYWFLEQHQRTFLHGAAVSDGRAAAMLVGPGGSGKSSTALACLLAGMDYLGDDYLRRLPRRPAPCVLPVWHRQSAAGGDRRLRTSSRRRQPVRRRRGREAGGVAQSDVPYADR